MTRQSELIQQLRAVRAEIVFHDSSEHECDAACKRHVNDMVAEADTIARQLMTIDSGLPAENH